MVTIQRQQDVEDLVSLVHQEIGDFSIPTLIHAGHFSLTAMSGIASDNLDNKEDHPTAVREIVELALTTWEAGCRLASRFPSGRCHLMTLVNDWQLLKLASGSVRDNERLASQARAAYYRQTPCLPVQFAQMLAQYALPLDTIFKSEEDRWLFSESELRFRLTATVSAVLQDPVQSKALGLSRYFTPSGDPIVRTVDGDGGEFCLVYCGNTNCAGEFLQLLGDLQDRGIRRFVNLYPMQCREPVRTGTDIAYRMFGLSNMEVINIALPNAPDQIDHACIDRADDRR